MKLYKLTDAADQTYNGCQWGPGVAVETNGIGDLCNSGWTHWYTDPLLAVFLNPVHGNFDLDTAHLWEGEGEPKKFDSGLKVGCHRATTLRQVELPKVTLTQRVAFAILCALQICTEAVFVKWARRWLAGRDRTHMSAVSAYKYVLSIKALYLNTLPLRFLQRDDLAVAHAVKAITAALTAIQATTTGNVRYLTTLTEVTAASVIVAVAHSRPLDLPKLAKRAMQY